MKTLDIIILGRRLGERGEISEIFRHRLDRGVEVYREKKRASLEVRIIVSGGDLGRRGISEAKAGGDYVQRHLGIPAADLTLEEKALDTVSNAVYAKALILEGGCSTPIVVSSCYHIPRVSYIFSHVLGPDFVPTYVSAPTGLDPDAYSRHWHSESKKMIEAVRFLDEIDAAPGHHERVFNVLRERGLVVEDTVD